MDLIRWFKFWGAAHNCLPGDCKNGGNFGFPPRGILKASGDGNGIIEGIARYQSGGENPFGQCGGENPVFWVDLSMANLINESFSLARPDSVITYQMTHTTTPKVEEFIPKARIGQGNFMYVFSGGYISGGWTNNGINYMGISAVNYLDCPPFSAYGYVWGNPGLTPLQAFTIDTKIDDGLPQSGKMLAKYLDREVNWMDVWAIGGGGTAEGASGTAATSPSSTTCYDNGNISGAVQKYSTGVSGVNYNCALSIRF